VRLIDSSGTHSSLNGQGSLESEDGFLADGGDFDVSLVRAFSIQALTEDEYQSYSGIRSNQQTAPGFVTGHDRGTLWVAGRKWLKNNAGL